MTTGKKRKPPSTDLVKRAETMPASQESVGLSEASMKRLRASYAAALKESRQKPESEAQGAVFTQYATVAGVAAFALIASPWLAVPLGMLGVLSSGVAAYDAKHNLDKANDKSTEIQHEFLLKLRREFIDAQRHAYGEKQDRLLAAAEEHLAKGGLLDETAMSYLAAIPPEKLRGASDQLAISVMQVRAMLDYIRSRRIDLDGERGVPKPARFSDYKLSPRMPEHRPILRAKLAENRFRIAEDEPPEFAKPEIAFPETRTQTRKEKMARYFGTAFFIKGDRERAAAFEIPEVKPAELPPLRNVQNLEKIIGNYERAHGRLDLPAMRGWGGPGPKSLTFKPL